MSEERISYAQLIAYAAGELTGTEAAAVAAYLATDPSATETVARYRLALNMGHADDSAAPPAQTVAAAKALFRVRQERAVANRPTMADWWAELQRVVARLVFDSRPAAALAGLRGASDAVQLSYECELADVDLELESGPHEVARVSLRGQISPRGGQAVVGVALAAPGSFAPTTAEQPDEHGMFVLAAPPGRYDLLIAFSQAVVVVPDIQME